MKDRRLGKFSIYKEEIENYPENVKLVMKEVIIVRAEYMFDRNCIEYTAICDQFDLTPPECYPSEYKISIQEGRAIFTKRF